MERNGLACLFIALLWAVCLPSVAHSIREHPAQASVCQLTHFGPAQDGRVYKTSALYSTDLRHGAWLVDPTNTTCRVPLGVQQSDIDGSVARFMQALVDGIMRNGPGTKRALRAELVFRWVKTDPQGASLGKPWVAKGMVELRRVFSSSLATLALTSHPSGRAKSRAPLNSSVRLHSMDSQAIDDWANAYVALQQDGSRPLDGHQLFWAAERFMFPGDTADAEDCWATILAILARDPPKNVLGVLAAGPLEDLIHHVGPEFIDRIELQARKDPAFRHLLGGVWASSTPDIWVRVEAARGTTW